MAAQFAAGFQQGTEGRVCDRDRGGGELETPAQAFVDARLSSSARSAASYDLGANRPDDPFFPYSAGTFGTGANHAVRRSFALELGGYDEALGPGTIASAGEELDLFLRVIQAGWTLAV